MKRILKITGLALLIITALLLIAYLFIYINVRNRMNTQYAFSKESIPVARDSAAITSGRQSLQPSGTATIATAATLAAKY